MIKRQGSGARETFTVRKQSFGVGVERTFPLHSPKIEKLEVAARGDVRRAKLYYLRDKVGKSARVAERRWGIKDEMVGGGRGVRSRRCRGRRGRRGGGRAGRAAAGRGRGARRERSSRPPKRERPRSRPLMLVGTRRRRTRSQRPNRSRSPRPTPLPTRLKKTESPAAPQHPGRAPRARHHRRARSRAGARDPGLHHQAVPDPVRVDGADPGRRPTRSGQQVPLPLQGPPDRGHRRLPSARGRQRRWRGRRVRRPEDRGGGKQWGRLRSADSPGGDRQLHQADRRRARRHPQRPERSPGGQREDRPGGLHQPLYARAEPAICPKRSPSRPTITS